MTAGKQPSRRSRRSSTAVSRIGLLLLIALCVLFVSSYTNRLLRKTQVNREISEWEQRIDEAELYSLQLQEELDHVRSQSYIGEVARKDLDMALEGDTVFIVLQGTVTPDALEPTQPVTPGSPGAVSVSPGDPTWKQWLSVLAVQE